MVGISDKALKSNYAENKYRFQKQELQSKEFNDGSGLEMYEFKYRFDDPQLGRFWSIDPLADKYEYNSPYAFSEDKVIAHVELEGLEARSIVQGEAVGGSIARSVATAQSGSASGQPGVGEAIAKALSPAGVLNATQKGLEELGASSQTHGAINFDGISYPTIAPLPEAPAPAIDFSPAGQEALNKYNQSLGLLPPNVVKAEAGKFNGQQDTHSQTQREAFRKAKDQNGVPRSAQPDKTSITRDKNTGAPLKTYEYTNSNGEKVVIRKDNPVTYPDGGHQGEHYNAGKPAESNGKLKQHHTYGDQ